VVDGYCHCGISKYLPVEDVVAVMSGAGVARAVLVQHFGELDNSYLAHVVRDRPQAFVAVALLDPGDDAWQQQLADVAAREQFRGLRVPRDMVLRHPAACREAAEHDLVLVVDAPSGIGELRSELEDLLRRDARIIVSHLGYPAFADGTLLRGRELFELARFPSLRIVLSSPDWPDEPRGGLYDFVSEVLDVFGPRRLLWGSNFPLCGVDGYRRSIERVSRGTWGLSPREVEQVTRTNAEAVWFA
jgi:predicted TIM-barrel fold metal-dependent hydrolase